MSRWVNCNGGKILERGKSSWQIGHEGMGIFLSQADKNSKCHRINYDSMYYEKIGCSLTVKKY